MLGDAHATYTLEVYCLYCVVDMCYCERLGTYCCLTIEDVC